MRNGFCFLLIGLWALSPTAADASIIPDEIEVDFRDPAWAAARTEGQYTVGAVTLTALPGGSRLYQDQIDGIGIYGGQHDEIDWWESLEVTFAGGMQLEGAWFTDLFAGEATPRGETGRIELYEDEELVQEWTFDAQDSPGGGGDLFLSFGETALTVTRATLYALQARDNEYSLAGFEAELPPPPEPPGPTPVPSPGALALAGIGLWTARRFFRQTEA